MGRLFRKPSADPQAREMLDRLLLLGGRTASRQLPRRTRIADLADVEFRVFSQWGEDGIIEWLAAHVPVPSTSFVEFGVETFREANCRFLLENRNWRGLVMDGDAESMRALRGQALYWKYDLTAVAAFVTAENINDLLRAQGFSGPLGLLSIDIDGNDYWVWKAIDAIEPAIVVCEYNPVLGDTAPVVVPYDPAFRRFDAHHSGLYFGASIAALCKLAERRGYAFVGTNSNGINAFFVKRELAGDALACIAEVRAYPSRHRDSRDPKGELSFVAGRRRFELIQDLPVVNIESGRTLPLRDIGEPYSAEWRARL